MKSWFCRRTWKGGGRKGSGQAWPSSIEVGEGGEGLGDPWSDCCGEGKIVGVWVAGWVVIVVVVFEVRYWFSAVVPLLVPTKLCSTVGSGNGQPTVLLLVRRLALMRWIGLMPWSRGGKGSPSTSHGRFRLWLPFPRSKLLSRTEVDCEKCGVVLVLNQLSSLDVKVSSSIDMRSPLYLSFSDGNRGLGGNRGLKGYRGLANPDVAVVPVHFRCRAESVGSITRPGK